METPEVVQDRLFAAADVAAKQLREHTTETMGNWSVAATTMLLTEFNKVPTTSVLQLLHKSPDAPQATLMLSAEDVATHIEALVSAEVMCRFITASAVHAWALCALAAELAVWVWRLSSAPTSASSAVDIISLALRLSIMQAQAEARVDINDTKEDFVSASEVSCDTRLGDNFVVLLTHCLLSAAQTRDSPKVAAFADALAVCIGNRSNTKKLFFENGGLEALHTALEAAMDVQKSHRSYYTGFFACFDLLRRAFYGLDASFTDEYVKKYTPYRLRSTLLAFLTDQTPAAAPEGFAAATASTCAVLATSSKWRDFLLDRNKLPPFRAANFLIESAAHLFAWSALAFHETVNLDDLDAEKAVSLAVKLIENRFSGSEPRDPKLVGAAILVLRRAHDRGIHISQSALLIELFKKKVLTPKFARGYFQDRIYNHALKFVEAISPLDTSNFAVRNDEKDLPTSEISQQSKAKQEQLIKKMLPAIRIVAPFLTALLAAYEHENRDTVFLQVYCQPHLGERAGQILPPVVFDAVCKVSFTIRIAHVCDNPSLRALGKSLPDLFSLPEPEGDAEEVALAQSVVDRHFEHIVSKHCNVTGMEVSTIRQCGAASDTPSRHPEVVVAIYVFEKGIIPCGSSPLPRALAVAGNEGSFAVDVREGHFELFVEEAMVRNADEAYAGCSVSATSDRRTFSIGVYAQLNGVPGFITCAHGIKEPGQFLRMPTSTSETDKSPLFTNKTSTEIGTAHPEHVHYESAGGRFPDGVDSAFVTTTNDMLRLSFIDLPRRQWLNVLTNNDDDETFPLTNEKHIPTSPVRIIGPASFPLVAAESSPTSPTMHVIKAGRSSGLTRGSLRARRQLNIIHGALMSEANVPPVTFKHMLTVMNDPKVGHFSIPGDSGSPILLLERHDEPFCLQAWFVGILLGSFNGDTVVLPHTRIASAFHPSKLVFGNATAVLPPALIAQPAQPADDDAIRVTVRLVAKRLEVNETDLRPGIVTLDEALTGAKSVKEKAHLRRHYSAFDN